MNKIVFELCAEDRARLDAIIAGLAKVGAPVCHELKAVANPTEEAHAEPAPAEPVVTPEPVEVAPAPLPDPAPAPEVKPVSLGEFQRAIVTRCAESAEVKAKVQQLIHQYAASVSAVPEDKRPEVLAALARL